MKKAIELYTLKGMEDHVGYAIGLGSRSIGIVVQITRNGIILRTQEHIARIGRP